MGSGLINHYDHGVAGSRRLDPVKARPLPESILRLIWRERQISRAEIAARFSISRSTVTEIVKGLLQTDFIVEAGVGKSRGGRRPIVLEFQDSARCIIGVDIGATHVSVALTDLRGQLIAWKEVAHPVRSDPEGTIALAINLIDSSLEESNIDPAQLLVIGAAVPSPVDPSRPEWLSEVVIPGWEGRSGLERLNQRYGVRVHLDNDANMGSLAEHRWGAGRGVNELMYLKLGFGIGAGYILDGQIYRGAAGAAGEFGHLPIDPRGRVCICGLRGCLATFVGSPALEARAIELLDNYPDSVLSATNMTISAIEEAALGGDALGLKIVREAADYLGMAVVGWCNLMNPQMVILGGGLTKVGALLVQPLQEMVSSCSLLKSSVINIITGELGQQAVAIGAATLAIEAAFDELGFLREQLDVGA